jgi:hypothetical protein
MLAIALLIPGTYLAARFQKMAVPS